MQGRARVVSLQKEAPGFARLRAEFPPGAADGVALGASVALNGTCLTVTAQPTANELCFDLIEETLRATNLGDLSPGSAVNFERSARLGDEIGGHSVSGHVHTTAVLSAREESEHNTSFTLAVPSHLIKYILPKARPQTARSQHRLAFSLFWPAAHTPSRASSRWTAAASRLAR